MADVAITGTRHARESDAPRIRGVLTRYADPKRDRLITGGCVGTDALAARIWRALGGCVHTVLPADHKLVDPEWREHCTSFEQMPAGSTYRDRDQRMVDLATRALLAFPRAPEDHPSQRRSGTWLTVRLGRKKGLIVQIAQWRGGADGD